MSISAPLDIPYPRLSLSRATLVFGFLSFFLGFLSAIPGIIIGHKARSLIKDNPYRFGGDRLALAGLLMCYFASVLSIATLLYFIMYPENLEVVAHYTGHNIVLSER